jgi:hypothetical protein
MKYLPEKPKSDKRKLQIKLGVEGRRPQNRIP